MERIEHTVDNGLCISCGLCKAVCPKQCIHFEKRQDQMVPAIKNAECVECGICEQICPGKGFDYVSHVSETENEDIWFGGYEAIYNAAALDEKIRQNAVSGGVVTQLVYNLLDTEQYQCAFLVDSHQYTKEQVGSECFRKGDSLEQTQKSRYLQVSHEKAAAYLLSHREERVILVGTGCFIHGILNMVECFGLNRSHYFIIGLFCDKTMTMNSVHYFERITCKKGHRMKQFFFRTKDVGGWPGGVKVIMDNGECLEFPNTERMKLKEYFQPETCLYCLDKLNIYADISVGDNYTGNNADKKGSSSVIIRTKEGMRVWDAFRDCFIYQPDTEMTIRKSQHLSSRLNNAYFASYKEKETGSRLNETGNRISLTKDTWKMHLQYRLRLWKIRVGSQYEKNPWLLNACLSWKNLKNWIKCRCR